MSGVARSYQSTENYQPLSPLWSSSEFQLIVQLSETQLYCFISSLSFLGAWQNIDMMISLNPMIHYQYTFLKMGLMLAATLWLSCQTLWNQDAAILFAFFFFFFFYRCWWWWFKTSRITVSWHYLYPDSIVSWVTWMSFPFILILSLCAALGSS